MNVSNMSFEIKENEYFYNLTIIDPRPSVIKANIPKLMPQIPIGKPKTSMGTINRSIFCNASSCKPSPSTTIQKQNFVTLHHHKHEQPDYSADVDIYPPTPTLINKYHKFILNILHGDIRQMYFSTK